MKRIALLVAILTLSNCLYCQFDKFTARVVSYMEYEVKNDSIKSYSEVLDTNTDKIIYTISPDSIIIVNNGKRSNSYFIKSVIYSMILGQGDKAIERVRCLLY